MNKAVDTNTILAQAEYTHWWFQARRAIMEYIFWKNIDNKQITVLSVGCGTGAELEHIGQYAHVTGLDIDKEVISFCKSKGLSVIEGDILDTKLPEQSFDIVVAMDVLEHIKDDYGALAQLARVLKKDGLLLVTVPAFEWLWSSFDEEGEFPHVRRYTKKTLLDLLHSQSLQISKMSYYNFFLFPFAYLARMSDQSFVSQMQPMPRWKNSLLRSLFAFEKYFLPWINFPFGVSLVAVCKK